MELFYFVLLLIIFFLILTSYHVLSSRFSNPSKSSPPVADGAWPFIGHLHIMSNNSPDRLPYITLSALADKHGPIFSIKLGAQRAVVVSNWKLAKQLFTTCDVVTSSRPRFMASVLMGYDLAMFGFAPYGRYWREVRKLISVELLSSRSLEIQRHIFVSETVQSMKELYKVWDDRRDGLGRGLVEMKEWFGNLNLNVVLRMVVGKRYFGSSGDSNEARECREVMRDFFELSGVITLGDAIPYLGWLDIGGYEKKMKNTSKKLDSLVTKWLREHQDEKRSNPQDFMGAMLATMQCIKLQSEYDDDTIIKSTCSNLISGASDTTSVMLIWALSLLLNNPRVLKNAQHELDQEIGRERRVSESDINNLVYLQAIIKETLRLYPAAPLGGIREFIQDCDVGGYHILKGTWLFINLWKLHRDPHIWGDDATKFRPERFLADHKDVDARTDGFQWIPFGGGRRICPGVKFALEMMPLVLANLLQSFEFSVPGNELVDMAGSRGMTNCKATPLDVYVVPRLCTNLYY